MPSLPSPSTRLLGGSRTSAALLGLALTVGLVGPVAASTAQAPRDQVSQPSQRAVGETRDQKLNGFRIKRTGRAAGSWIGSRILGTEVAYRVDPAAKNGPAVFNLEYPVDDLGVGNKGFIGSDRTARASWILSKYGDRRNGIQAAAVDAAVLHLVAGRTWRIGRPAGKRRIAQIKPRRRTFVRSYAKQMLRNSKAGAGPYALTLTVPEAPVTSGPAPVTAVLTNQRTGAPVPTAPIEFAFNGTTQTVFTDDAGLASLNLTPNGTALQEVVATAVNLPQWRLFVVDPTPVERSRLALAGRRTTLTQSGFIRAGQRAQAVEVSAASPTVMLGTALTGRYRVNAGQPTEPQQVTVSLLGPFDDAPATCTVADRPVVSATKITQPGGDYALPSLNAPRSGLYLWHVTAGGDSSTAAASACSSPVRVRAQASLEQSPAVVTVWSWNSTRFLNEVKVSGFDRAEQHSLTVTFYGPFATPAEATAVGCRPDRLVKSDAQTLTGNVTASFWNERMPWTTQGTYLVQAFVDDGRFIAAAASDCRAVQPSSLP